MSFSSLVMLTLLSGAVDNIKLQHCERPFRSWFFSTWASIALWIGTSYNTHWAIRMDLPYAFRQPIDTVPRRLTFQTLYATQNYTTLCLLPHLVFLDCIWKKISFLSLLATILLVPASFTIFSLISRLNWPRFSSLLVLGLQSLFFTLEMRIIKSPTDKWNPNMPSK